MNRVLLTKLHLVLAAFMFPAVLMFLVTGALYTWGNKGEWHEQVTTLSLSQPLAVQSESEITSMAIEELLARDLPIPSGNLKVELGEDAALTWNGARSEIELRQSADPGIVDVTIREASFHRLLVQLHKAKGSTYFKVYATMLAVVLFLLVFSGLVMGVQAKPLRKLTLASSVIGALAFAGFVALG